MAAVHYFCNAIARKKYLKMDESLKRELMAAALRNETAAFIDTDPVRFPHRYTDRRDIEVSGFISAWMAYGSRRVFLGVLEKLHTLMDAAGGPYRFIVSHAWENLESDPNACLYRFYKWSDYWMLCSRMASAYETMDSMEEFFAGKNTLAEGVRSLCLFFEGVEGIPVPDSPSANKRFYMFLRWMVREDSPVDFGIWTSVTPSALVIPLDTHVYQIATRLGLTARRNADLKTAVEITRAMAQIWPDDPARGDFALYGTEVS